MSYDRPVPIYNGNAMNFDENVLDFVETVHMCHSDLLLPCELLELPRAGAGVVPIAACELLYPNLRLVALLRRTPLPSMKSTITQLSFMIVSMTSQIRGSDFGLRTIMTVLTPVHSTTFFHHPPQLLLPIDVSAILPPSFRR